MDWSEIVAALGHRQHAGSWDARLLKAERSLGLKLPPSYRDYVSRLGWGELCDMFYVWVPGMLEDLSPAYHEQIEAMIELGDWPPRVIKADVLRRMVPFGTSANGDILAWLRPARTPAGAVELPIFLLARDNDSAPRLAGDLRQFVANVCLGGRLDKLFPRGRGTRWNLPRQFVPLSETRRRPARPVSRRAIVTGRRKIEALFAAALEDSPPPAKKRPKKKSGR